MKNKKDIAKQRILGELKCLIKRDNTWSCSWESWIKTTTRLNKTSYVDSSFDLNIYKNRHESIEQAWETIIRNGLGIYSSDWIVDATFEHKTDYYDGFDDWGLKISNNEYRTPHSIVLNIYMLNVNIIPPLGKWIDVNYMCREIKYIGRKFGHISKKKYCLC